MYKMTSLARSLVRYPPSASKALSNSKSPYSVTVGHNAFQQAQWLSTGPRSKSASKDQPLHDIIKDGASVHRVQYLIKQGFNPNKREPKLNENALHTAARMGDAKMCALLLYWGADIAHANTGGETPDEVACKGSEAEAFLFAMKSKLQSHHVRTGGMKSQLSYLVKQNMISAMRPLVNEVTQQSLDLSAAIEEQLLTQYIEGKSEYLYAAIDNLKPNQFLWFSYAFQEHLVNFSIKKTDEGELHFVIANHGDWSQKFHDHDADGKIYPKVYALKSDAPDASRDVFINHIADKTSEIFDEYLSAVNPVFQDGGLRDGYVFYREFDLSEIPGVEELTHYGTPGLPQDEDECATESHRAMLDYLFPLENSGVTVQDIDSAYERFLDEKIERIVPRLSGQHLDQVVNVAKEKKPPVFLESADNKSSSGQKYAVPIYRMNKVFSQNQPGSI